MSSDEALRGLARQAVTSRRLALESAFHDLELALERGEAPSPDDVETLADELERAETLVDVYLRGLDNEADGDDGEDVEGPGGLLGARDETTDS